MNLLMNVGRSKGDPAVLRSGRSSLTSLDRMARGLGWFSILLGAAELMAPRRLASFLGMEGSENLLRAYGAREIGSGVVTLSPDKQAGLWSRFGGDILDIATLIPLLHPANPKRGNVKLALAMVAGITALDLIGAQGLTAQQRAARRRPRKYSERSGFPDGVEAARRAAKEFTRLATTTQGSAYVSDTSR